MSQLRWRESHRLVGAGQIPWVACLPFSASFPNITNAPSLSPVVRTIHTDGEEQRKEAAHDEERPKDAKLSIRSRTVPVEIRPSLSVESENENRRHALVARLMGLDKFPPTQESSAGAGAGKRVKMQQLGAVEKCDEELKALQRIIEVVKTSISVGLGEENYELSKQTA
ncbi:hypothetical protein V6N12_002628 [Hibiscus sabdariffa]|uniref:DUF3741 domain-containing protein n=1 Tax=Hibiscus sabdariffa TaxID=183260 RepID=A0ABR2E9I9_9ROSI